MDDITDYLKDSEIMDYNSSMIQEKALKLSLDSKNQLETIKNIYEFVRDEILHSLDING
ncbi:MULTISPECIES: hypothetical protein [Methanobacterium]|uniref:Uncharacterized protein n=1 Tax=Methanobacterium veterum TaxID=408577 RepID=A0A9E5DM38_9EURY|nr:MULTISPECIES: hypothetical protein [Methanobacterium]MCZ3365981.1 hypothetical protein [Methanobacterium veterum]MCZ3371446.1 hypothetical protein [Methanobacterium veterum]